MNGRDQDRLAENTLNKKRLQSDIYGEPKLSSMMRSVSEDASDATPQSGQRRTRVLWAGMIALVVVIAYSDSLHGPFVFDDTVNIPLNPTIRTLWPPWRALTPLANGETVTGRPLLNLSLALNWAISGNSVYGYHVTNLIIHLLAALILFGVIRRTLLLPSMRRRWSESADLFAAVVSCIWAIHPLQTESVTYIVQRCESLGGLFYLLTLYCFIRGVRSGYRTIWLAGSITCCAVGMGVKEILISAPLMVLLYDRTFVSRSFGRALGRWWKYYIPLACTWAVLALIAIRGGSRLPMAQQMSAYQRLLAFVSAKSGNRGGTMVSQFDITPLQYLVTQCYAITHYLKLSFWPRPLILDYGMTLVGSIRDVIPQAILIVALLCATALALWKAPRLGFLGAWFFATLALTSSVIPLNQTVAEHRMYLPLAAVVIFVAVIVHRVVGRIESETTATAIGVAVIAIVAALSFATLERNTVYGSELSIWQDTVDKKPDNSRAQMALGLALLALQRPTEALPHLDRAVELDPNSARARNNRGIAFFRLGELTRAIEDYTTSLQIRPRDGGVYMNRALARYALKDYDQARDDIAKAKEFGINPDPKIFRELPAASSAGGQMPTAN